MTESALDERFSGVLAPDAILPSQYFAGLRRRNDMSGERRLMIAILEDALHCFQKYVEATDPKHRQLFDDAAEWIAEDNPTWFFSFPNVCHTLDLDPDYVREGLEKWRTARGGRRTAVPASADEVASSGTAGDEAEVPLRRASNA